MSTTPSTTMSIGSALVIGGNGFLGHHIVKQLLADPSCTAVCVMDIDVTRNRQDKVDYFIGDVTVIADLRYVLERCRPNVVFNTASPIAYQDHEHAHEYFTVNVRGNENLIACFPAVGTVSAYVYTSSAPIIAGSGAAYSRADETYPTLATHRKGDPYHVAKAMADELVLKSNNPNGTRTACIRPTAMYGEGDRQMIHHTLDVLDNGQQNIWLGPNTALMDVVYVDHCANAHILAAHGLLRGIQDPSGPKVEGEAFNITDDSPLPPWTFCRKIWAEAGDNTSLSSIWTIPGWMALLMSIIAEWFCWAISFGKCRPKLLTKERIEFVLFTRTYDITKARERLSYSPKIGMDEAIRNAVGWALKDRGHGIPRPMKSEGS